MSGDGGSGSYPWFFGEGENLCFGLLSPILLFLGERCSFLISLVAAVTSSADFFFFYNFKGFFAATGGTSIVFCFLII
jgi:hypothetical protein